MEYYVRQTYDSIHAHSHLGVLFANELVPEVSFPVSPPFYPILVDPQLEVDSIIHAYGEWKKISHCYTPDQSYSTLTIGCFQSLDSILRSDPGLFAFYSYDAFYLIEIPDTLQLVSTPTRDTICAGECVTFSSNHSRVPGDFLWDLPGSDLGSAADSVVTVCYDQPGTYAVGLSTDHCHGTYSRTWPEAVVVLPRPSQTGGAAQTYRLLRGESLPLEICDNSLDWTVSWSPAAGLSCTDCPDPVYGGTESVQLTAVISLSGACPDTCRYAIEVVDGAAAAFSAEEPSICAGECFRFQNNSTAATRPIRFGPADDLREVPAGRPMLEYCPPEAGTYELLFIVGGELNSDTFIISGLVARSAPVPVAVQRDYSTTVDDLLTLFPGFEAETYRWQVLSGSLELDCPACPRVGVTPFVSGTVQLTAANGACSDSLLYQIEVARQPALIYLPSAFSPNADGINDTFRAYGRYFEVADLQIYDRYGGLLHRSSGPAAAWDGRSGGRPVVPGVYVYVLRYRNIYGEEGVESGSVVVTGGRNE